MSQPEEMKKFVGVLTKDGDTLLIKPCSKKGKSSLYPLNSQNFSDAREDDVVLAERIATGGASQAKVMKILGQKDSPGILTKISLYEQGLSDIFSQAALKQAKSLTVPELGDREDLRDVPLVTVDGKDSRDFDDAIFAENTADGGMHLIVAIADVSWYVRPGDDLDKEAYPRGTSTYFPDRAVPMLPEDVSNGICSLKPQEDRAVMVFHHWIDKDGNRSKTTVNRGLMRSAARLTYEQLQAAKDGHPDAVTAPLMDTVVNPLYKAYTLLRKASEVRGAMDMDAPEYTFEIDATGKATKVAEAGREESHKVIAEFMILNNTAVNAVLKEKNMHGLHRVHDKPPQIVMHNKIGSLREYLATFGLALPAGEITSPLMFRDVMKKARQMPEGNMIINAIIRSMAKAECSTEDLGHFGLGFLPPEGYDWSTSPIRRYFDLEKHRELVTAFNLGAGGLDITRGPSREEMAAHINDAEKLSVMAERAAKDRFAADYLSTHIGEEFKGRITGVIGGGVFVRLNNTGSEGLLPVRSLPKDYYNFDDKAKTLTGKRNSLVFKPGDEMTVRVKEADGLTGSILFQPANNNKTPATALRQDFNKQNTKRPQRRKRHRNRHHRPG